MRKTFLWIALTALPAAALVALAATAAAPPELARALGSQRALAAEHPHDPQVLNDLGNLLVLVGETEEAEAAYRRALEIAPDMSSARYNLALLLIQAERDRAALQELEHLLAAEPRNAWAHYQVGAVHERRGAARRAVKHYSRAFRLDPQLAFPEINPHVIENRHMTEAMLLAYRDLPLAAEAPKTYEQPGRIVSFMIPAQEEPALAAGRDPGMRPRPSFAPGEGGPGEVAAEGDRVLREQDLERGGQLNQVIVPGGVVQPQPQGGTRMPVRSFTPPDAEGRQPGALPQPGPQPGRQRFVPGIPSTGRLEIELVPGGGDEVTPAG